MKKKKHFAASLPAVLFLAGLCAMGFAQQGPHRGQGGNAAAPQVSGPSTGQAGNAGKPSPATLPGQGVPAPQPTQPASLLDHPAQSAKVNLAQGKLSVQADNSSLWDILHQISRASGMKIEGLQAGRPDQRLFGSYGPGVPQEVLSELLDGAGYNVMMLGRTLSGAPKELALTPRSGAGASGPQPQQNNNPQADNEDNGEEDVQPTQYPDDSNQPQQNYIPPPGPPEMRRTPQEMLEELQRMRQQQQQQQDPNQNQNQQPQQN